MQLGGALRHTDGHRPSSETEAVDGRIRVAQKVSDEVNLVSSFRGGTNEWEIPGPVGGDPGVGSDNDWWIGDVGARSDVSDDWDLTTKVWRFDADVRFTDDLHEPNEAWDARWATELFQGDDRQSRLPNYVLANAGIGYRLDNGVGLRVRIENLFDEDYELFAGWPMPGTSVNAGVDWVF